MRAICLIQSFSGSQWSFQTSKGIPAPAMLSTAIRRIANGATVGMAMESFRLRSAQFATRLALADPNAPTGALNNLRMAGESLISSDILNSPSTRSALGRPGLSLTLESR